MQTRPAERVVLVPSWSIALQQSCDIRDRALLRRGEEGMRELKRLVGKLHLDGNTSRRELRHDRVGVCKLAVRQDTSSPAILLVFVYGE